MYLEISRNLEALDLATPPSLTQIWNALHIVWIRDKYDSREKHEEVMHLTQLFMRNAPRESHKLYSIKE